VMMTLTITVAIIVSLYNVTSSNTHEIFWKDTKKQEKLKT
jgi:hypothetical protein